MAALIFAIRVGIRRLSALVTYCNYFITDFFSQTIIKYKILTMKFIRKVLFFHCVGIMDYTSFKMKYVFKPFMQKISACFFTANAAGTIHDDGIFRLIFQHIGSHWQLLAK